MPDPEARKSELKEPNKNYIDQLFFGCFCGFCCGSIGSLPLLNYNETTRRQKAFILGLVTAGVIASIVSVVIGIAYSSVIRDILKL